MHSPYVWRQLYPSYKITLEHSVLKEQGSWLEYVHQMIMKPSFQLLCHEASKKPPWFDDFPPFQSIRYYVFNHQW
jgi:hypothetical protein